MRPLRARLASLLVAFVAAATVASPAAALTDQERLIEESRLTALTLMDDPDVPQIPDFVRDAKAVLIFPELFRGGFIIGGEGGIGVMMVRQQDGSWSDPAFYIMAAGSVGLQIGGQISEMLLLVMTEQGLSAIMDRYVTLGVDLNIAVIALGGGVDARTGLDLNADMYAFSRNQGLFAGGALEGSVISDNAEWNDRYYARGATPAAIFAGQYTNPQAQPLRDALPR